MLIRLLFLSSYIICSFVFAKAQNKSLFQQEISYKIDAKVDTANKFLNGVCQIHYKNNSSDTLNYLWLYQRPNACIDEKTPFCNRLIEKGYTDLYFADKKEIGRAHI